MHRQWWKRWNKGSNFEINIDDYQRGWIVSYCFRFITQILNKYKLRYWNRITILSDNIKNNIEYEINKRK